MPLRPLTLFLTCLTLLATEPNAATRRWWTHVTALSGDNLQGRDTGSEGYRQAARYVVTQFEHAGLHPAGENGYYQPVHLHQTRLIPSASRADLLRGATATPVRWLHQFTLRLQENMPERVEAPLLFAGSGDAPPNLDPTGHLLVTLAAAGTRRPLANSLGLISIDNPKALEPPRWPLQYAVTMRLAATPAPTATPLALRWNPADADLLFAGSGHTYSELTALAAAAQPLPWFPLPATFRATAKLTHNNLQSDNILAILPGSDPTLAKEYVVVSAHLDGYGLGESWGADNIYNGAFDDAAYVATLIDLAQRLHDAHRTTRRSILFCVVTAEEKGLLGSKYFTEHPTVPKEQMVANINLDQLRPLFPLRVLTTLALDRSTLGQTAAAIAQSMNIRLQPDPEPERNLLRRSDHWNFMQIGVPALGFIFGFEKGSPDEAAYREWYAKRYHSPLDDLDQPWVPEAAAKFNDFFDKLVESIANAPDRPQWTGPRN